MKDITNYQAPKYASEKYIAVEDGIFKLMYRGLSIYYTSLSFVQEPEYDEGEDASDISQYPLEDILEKFNVFVSDFYDDINVETSQICYQEFASRDLEDIQNLRSIIGKHVYNLEDDDGIDLIIE